MTKTLNELQFEVLLYNNQLYELLWFPDHHQSNCHDITEILLKVALNIISLPPSNCHDITEILLKVALNIISLPPSNCHNITEILLKVALSIHSPCSLCMKCSACYKCTACYKRMSYCNRYIVFLYTHTVKTVLRGHDLWNKDKVAL